MEHDFSLKDFIKQTLTEICEAVDEARSVHGQIATQEETYNVQNASKTLIEFDVAVTVSEAKGLTNVAGGKGGIKYNIGVLSGSAGAEGSSEKINSNERSHLSRIKFAIPAYFQHDEKAAKARRDSNKQTVRTSSSNRGDGW